MGTLCIYHDSCTDGFGAAWVVHRALGDCVTFVPGVYGEPPPDVSGKDVILVDFSYKRPIMEHLIRQARSVLVLDHHDTAEKDLAGLAIPGKVHLVFSQDHSGAVLAWEHYFPHADVPRLLHYIEDYDLWKFDLPHCQEVMNCVMLTEFDSDAYEKLIDSPIDTLVAEGTLLERKFQRELRDTLVNTQRTLTVAGYDVPVANVPAFMVNEAGSRLCQGQPFAVLYYDTPKGRKFSLRSTQGGVNVSKVAEYYGGGGRTHTAGFRLSWSEILDYKLL